MTKKQRREQKSKVLLPGENKDWMRARLNQHNSNLRVPSGKVYKRPAPGKGWS